MTGMEYAYACRKEVQQIFDRYIKNNVRRLKRDEAVAMLKTEFNFSDDQAACMFTMFDKDKNGVMSIWEFQQFYMCVGNRSVRILRPRPV